MLPTPKHWQKTPAESINPVWPKTAYPRQLSNVHTQSARVPRAYRPAPHPARFAPVYKPREFARAQSQVGAHCCHGFWQIQQAAQIVQVVVRRVISPNNCARFAPMARCVVGLEMLWVQYVQMVGWVAVAHPKPCPPLNLCVQTHLAQWVGFAQDLLKQPVHSQFAPKLFSNCG